MTDEASFSNSQYVGILTIPHHLIENICRHLLINEPENFGSSKPFDITLEFPRDLLSLRSTCKQLRDVVDECKFEFSLSIGTLLTLKEWPILDFILTKPMWKVTELQVNILWKRVETLNRASMFEKIMNRYRQLLEVKRLRLLWNGFNPYEKDSLSYSKTVLGEVFTNNPSAKLELQFYSIPETVKLEDTEVMPNADKLIAPLIGAHNSNSTLNLLVHLFPNLVWLRFGYHLSSLAPLKNLHFLKYLEIENVQMHGRTNLAILPSVKHLCFTVKSYESPFSLSEFLTRSFPNLDTIQLASFKDEEEFRGLKPLIGKYPTAQIAYKFLYLFAENEHIESLGIETIWSGEEMDKLINITSDLQSLVFGLVASLEQTCKDYIPLILHRFKQLNFLIINLFDSEVSKDFEDAEDFDDSDGFDGCEDFDDLALDHFHDINEILATHPVKLILIFNGCSESSEQFVYMKGTLTSYDIEKIKKVLNDFARIVRYDFAKDFSTVVDSRKSCSHF